MSSSSLFTPIPEKLKDFRVFLTMIWRHLRLPDPTPVQLDIANYLQYGPRRKIIQAFRGVGKSWITSAYVLWRLRQDPNLKFMIVSASKDRADNFTTFTLRLIQEVPLLQCLMPTSEQRCSKVAFDVGPARADHAPSVVSKGIFSQLAGSRAHEIIPDDIEVPNNAFTQAMRDKLSEAVKEFDAILKPGGTITYLGTPQTEQSLYNILPDRGYEVRIWPARFPNEEQKIAYGDRLAPFIANMLEANPALVGKSTDPKRFSEEDLFERELSYGRSGFQLQFMLDTKLSDAERYPLRLSDLIVMHCSPTDAPEKPIWAAAPGLVHNDIPCVGFNGDKFYGPMAVQGQWLPYSGSVMAIDPSGRGKDECAVCVIKMLNGYLYLTALRAYRDGYGEETLQDIVRLAKAQQVNKVVIEANFGDGMFTKLIEPYFVRHYPVTIEEVKHSKQKEKRIIDTLEPVMNQHRLVVDKEVIRWDFESTKNLPPEVALKYQLFYQMTRLTKEKGSLTQDDRIDCVAIGVAYWVDQMNADAEKQMASRRAELLDQELRIWQNDTQPMFDMQCILGGSDPRFDSMRGSYSNVPRGSTVKSSGWLKM
jgi:hypothetical protein